MRKKSDIDKYNKRAYYFLMITLAKTTQHTKASPKAIFALWADVDHWADYDDGIEWVKLTDKFKPGGHYVIKPKGGPKVKSDIVIAQPNKHFVDISRLMGAKLKFDHTLTQQSGATTVDIVMTVSGPLAWFWAKVLGKNQQADLEKSTAQLIAKAERAS